VVVARVAARFFKDMKSAIHDFYISLFDEPKKWTPKVDSLFLPSLSDFDMGNIEVPFTGEEVHKGLLDCYGDKTPTPNGMTMTFLQSNWDTVTQMWDVF